MTPLGRKVTLIAQAKAAEAKAELLEELSEDFGNRAAEFFRTGEHDDLAHRFRDFSGELSDRATVMMDRLIEHGAQEEADEAEREVLKALRLVPDVTPTLSEVLEVVDEDLGPREGRSFKPGQSTENRYHQARGQLQWLIRNFQDFSSGEAVKDVKPEQRESTEEEIPDSIQTLRPDVLIDRLYEVRTEINNAATRSDGGNPREPASRALKMLDTLIDDLPTPR